MFKVTAGWWNNVKLRHKVIMTVQVSWYTVNFRPLQESLCGTRDLSHVTSLEVCVDTQENSLGNFGKIYSIVQYTKALTVYRGLNHTV